MKTKRILSSALNLSSLTQDLYELEKLIEESQAQELFDSYIYIFRKSVNVFMGVSIIGPNSKLDSRISYFDLKMESKSILEFSFLNLEQKIGELKVDEIILLDSNYNQGKIHRLLNIAD